MTPSVEPDTGRPEDMELRPCPFCGGQASVESSKTLGDRLFVIACSEDSTCRGSGLGIYVMADCIGEAVAQWNLRASDRQSRPSASEPEIIGRIEAEAKAAGGTLWAAKVFAVLDHARHLAAMVEELVRHRDELLRMEKLQRTSRSAAEKAIADIVGAYEREVPMRTADAHSAGCDCLRCGVDRAASLLNKEAGE